MPFFNYKIDPQLNLATSLSEEELLKSNLSVGYDPKTNTWEVIVKFNGDLNEVLADLNITGEIISYNYAILTLEQEKINLLPQYTQIEYVEKPKSLILQYINGIREACISNVKDNEKLDGAGVLVGIIDSGIDYTHKDFTDDLGKSRILYIWDQSISGNPPENFNSGTEFTKNQIDEALNSEKPLSIVNSVDTVGHGTHIAGIIAGNGKASNGINEGIASKSEIIVVKLGSAGNTSFANTTEIMRGLKYLVDKALELKKPMAINLSFGTNNGSHSGNSIFEEYIDEISKVWKTSICIASGNEGDTGKHYSNIVKSNQKIEIEFVVKTERTSFSIALWKSFIDKFDIEVIAPNGISTGIISYTISEYSFNFVLANLRIAFGQPSPYNIQQEIFMEVIANGNYVFDGNWKIIIYSKKIVDGRFDIWLPITESVSNNTYFLTPDYYTTLTLPSTTSSVITVGGYNSLTNSISRFSGRGYTTDNRVKPDLTAPAVNILSTAPGGGYDTLTGTSIATPFVTGSCALLMQWGIVDGNDIYLYGERLKSFLHLGAKRKENLKYPNKEWGFGSLCLANTLAQLELYKTPYTVSKFDIKQINNNFAYSDEYIDVLVESEYLTEEFLNSEGVILCETIMDEYSLLYIKISNFINIYESPDLISLLETTVILGIMNTEALDASGILAIQEQPYLNLSGNGVLVGVVDTGINYTLDDFIYEDGTSKIVSIWDQTIDGIPPDGSCFGMEYTNEDINLALQSENPFDIVKSTDEIGHGTALASIMASREKPDKSFIGACPNSDIVVVKLKQAKKFLKDINFIDEKTPAYSSTDLILGIDYLYKKSKELGKPISICIGLGSNQGGHIGTYLLERYISEILKKRGLCISICSGNEGDANHHAMVEFKNGETEKSIEFIVDKTEKGVKLQLWTYVSDRIYIGLKSPLGEIIKPIEDFSDYDKKEKFVLSNTNIRILAYSNVANGYDRAFFITLENPSSGIWTINLYCKKPFPGIVHGWLPISQFIGENTKFLNADPFYTVTVPATASQSLSVGGYNSYDNSLYTSSGRGPTRLNVYRPSIVAPSVRISALDTRGNVISVTGTSYGTAVTAGAAALLLEWGVVKGNQPYMSTVQITNYFMQGAFKREYENYPNNIVGFGYLDLLNTFSIL